MTNLNTEQRALLAEAAQLQMLTKNVVDVFNKSIDIYMLYSQDTIKIEMKDIPMNSDNEETFGRLKRVGEDKYQLDTSTWQTELISSMGSSLGKMALCAAIFNTTSVETLFDRNDELERLILETMDKDFVKYREFWLTHIDGIVAMCDFQSIRFESAPYEELLKQYDVNFAGFCRLVSLYETGQLNPDSELQRHYIECKEASHQVTIPLYALAEALCQK